MSHILFEKFGYCHIPKNTLLFRGDKNPDFNDCMFFTTQQWVAGCFNESIHVYKTNKPIKVLFLIDKVNANSWSISSLPQLYQHVFPNESSNELNDLDIKKRDNNIRDKLVQKLFEEHAISGWFTSIENKVELEVCLFDTKANSVQLQLLETIHKKDKKYIKDSVEKIKIFPPKSFYENSKQQMIDQVPGITNEKDYYGIYKKNDE
jgi:hypothetical protein